MLRLAQLVFFAIMRADGYSKDAMGLVRYAESVFAD